MEDYLKELLEKVKGAKEKQTESKQKAKIPEADITAKREQKKVKIAASAEELAEVAKEKEQQILEPKIQEIKPVEGKGQVEKELEKAEKTLVASYGKVKIYKLPDKPMYYYVVPVPRPTKAERSVINILKEAATRLIAIEPYQIRDPEQRRIVYKQKILDIIKAAPELQIPRGKEEFYAEAVVREMVGYGLIDPLIQDDRLEEIMVIGPRKPVYVFHREYEMMISNIEFYSEDEIQDLINRIAREVGRRVDLSSPLLDARLPDGSRVNATIPPASVAGSTLTIRKFRKDPYSIIDLINLGTLSEELAAFLWLAVEGMQTKPANILIAGGTGSGKTTTLNVLASFVPSTERVITIEDTAELNLPLEHWIRLEARPPGLEGKGEITLDILTKNALRMRPDRIIVGEVRHAEAFTLFTALNTGHDGCFGTIHANSPQETIVRIVSPPMNVPEIMLSGLDFIIVQHRLHDRKKGTIRRFTEVAEISGVLEGKAQTQTIYERDPVNDTIVRTKVPSRYLAKLARYTGLSKKRLQEEINEREAFLKKLMKENVREIREVARRCEEFLASRSIGEE
ncbi:MAG: Flp pilus assembly complex ATPase component TadA [Candidatus Diapherotrites archaeon]|nr:Flp pilus assembly complex ATPase component TadA [Candidatus Diapherotrites archaeon]